MKQTTTMLPLVMGFMHLILASFAVGEERLYITLLVLSQLWFIAHYLKSE